MKSQANKKNTRTISFNVGSKSNTNPSKISKANVQKDEEKTYHLSTKNAENSNSAKQTTKNVDSKPSVSRYSNPTVSLSKISKFDTRLVFEKQTQSLKNKPVSSKSKIVTKPLQNKSNNVMNTIQNVTVSSPPPKRKQIEYQSINKKTEPRKGSKNRDKAHNINVEFQTTTQEHTLKVKEPVAFEVVFEKNQKTLPENKFKNCESKSQIPDDCEYDDDFESYDESDFEVSSSSELISHCSSSSKSTSMDDRESPTNSSETHTDKSECEESELTHIPITVIHREKEFERKLDSGNYDLNSQKHRIKESFESDTLANFEQLDSGISYENNNSADSIETVESVTYGGFSKFFILPTITKRGAEIMSKIKFDKISFTLLDLQPFSYDVFMRIYGNSCTMQCASQTLQNYMENKSQTDEPKLRSIWTQHPPTFDFYSLTSSQSVSSACGELNEDKNFEVVNDNIFESISLNLSKLTIHTPFPRIDHHRNTIINFERLNNFLNSSSAIITRILSRNGNSLQFEPDNLPLQSKGFFKLNTNFLTALRVIRVFANSKFDLILTVHESIDNVYYTDFSNLIMVWSNADSEKPLRLLSTWSEVSRAEICSECSELIVCGLKDGSIAMWDLRETYSFCSKLDGHLNHFAATFSVTSSWGEADDIRAFDSGAVVDIRSFRSAKTLTCGQKFKTVQFASLYESGFLAIWTLVETSKNNYEFSMMSNSKFEYSSPWARVKLIQSAICNLRNFVETKSIRPKSSFEHKKSNFQKNVFLDSILKELAESQNDVGLDLEGLRFINLDCGTESIFVGTNKNFIIACSRTLKRDRVRKINIVGNRYLFPTAIKLLENEDYLAVGLSNGSVMILNCNQNKIRKQQAAGIADNYYRFNAKRPTSNQLHNDIGKTCAIQNIIRNERESLACPLLENEFQIQTDEFNLVTIEENRNIYQQKIFDEQILLSGSILRKDLIQGLEFSNDGLLLFALTGGKIRIYDFSSEKEVLFHRNTSLYRNFLAFATNKHKKEKTIILLDNENNVEINLLK